jgi:hypothetical protein
MAAKVTIIFGVLYLVFRDCRYLVLAVVAARSTCCRCRGAGKSRMLEPPKPLLVAWASFDDSITVLITVYATALVFGGGDDGVGVTVIGAGVAALVCGTCSAARCSPRSYTRCGVRRGA